MSNKSNMKDKKIKDKYKVMTKEVTPKSKKVKDCVKAFVVGGLICDVGQIIINVAENSGYTQKEISNILPIIMILLGAVLTGAGIYSKLAQFGGAGTVVPITGFANAVVAPAIEFKKEGFVFGVAAKMFTIAGPVLVYGISTSVIIGIIYYFL